MMRKTGLTHPDPTRVDSGGQRSGALARSGRVLALLALVTLVSPTARGIVGEDPNLGPTFMLQRISVTISPTGVVRYDFAGLSGSLAFTGFGAWDPVSRQTAEKLTELNGNLISSSATCLTDPWLTGEQCSNSKTSSQGYAAGGTQYILSLQAPISARFMSVGDRATVRARNLEALAAKAAAEKAEADRKADEEKKKKILQAHLTANATSGRIVLAATPTPALRVVKLGGANKTAAISAAPAAPAVPTLTPTPTPRPAYPLYGAAYTPGLLPPSVKANQAVPVLVKVQNLSSQTWPSNGLFRLSYHWVKGGAIAVWDGERTVLFKEVKPGESIDLGAKVKAPATPGAYTLRWDMVQDGVGWFSGNGVGVKDQTVTVSN
jgi:hypothetical protein